MSRRLIAGLLACAALSASATDINKADSAELQTVPGIGASIAGKIVEERKNGNFKDWADVVDRIPGVGPKSAARLSAQGLTVNGAAYDGAPAAGAGKAKEKEKAKGPKADKPADKPAKG